MWRGCPTGLGEEAQADQCAGMGPRGCWDVWEVSIDAAALEHSVVSEEGSVGPVQAPANACQGRGLVKDRSERPPRSSPEDGS